MVLCRYVCNSVVYFRWKVRSFITLQWRWYDVEHLGKEVPWICILDALELRVPKEYLDFHTFLWYKSLVIFLFNLTAQMLEESLILFPSMTVLEHPFPIPTYFQSTQWRANFRVSFSERKRDNMLWQRPNFTVNRSATPSGQAWQMHWGPTTKAGHTKLRQKCW